MEAHLAECEGCAEHLRQIRITVAVTAPGSAKRTWPRPCVRTSIDLYRRWRRDRPAS